VATEPATADVPMQVDAAPEPAPADVPMQADVASDAVEADENAHFSELKVGGVSYACLCTQHAQTAGRWAELVTRDVDATGSTAAVDILGMDCEWAAPWHRGPGVPDRLATVQLFHHGSSGRRALVFSVAGLGGKLPAAMVALLGDARIAKVGVNIGGDASRLVRDFSCPVRGLYDLCNLNRKAGQKLKKAGSLEDLVRTHCPQDMHIVKADAAMEKGVRTGNWEAWPLSAEQIEYAAKDAVLGVMAFVHRFDSGSSDRKLSKEAIESLVDLEETTVESLASSKEKAEKAASKKKGKKNSGAESTPAAGDGDSTPAEGDAEAAPKEKKDSQHFFIAMRNSVLKAPNIGKKDHPQGPKDALAGVCIIVSGILDSFERKDLEEYVKAHGGTVSKGVTGKVTHLVTDHGEAGPSKLAKCKELNIPCVSEDVILKLVSDKC